MFASLSLKAFLDLAQQYRRVAVYKEIATDRLTPVGIFESLSREGINPVVLESGLHSPETGRYSFISFDSIAEFRVEKGLIYQKIGSEKLEISQGSDPLETLRQLLKKLDAISTAPEAALMPGAVGFMTYDAIRLFEAIPSRHLQSSELPQLLFNFYQTTLIFDHLRQKLTINILVEVGDEPQQVYELAQEKIAQLIQHITTAKRIEHSKINPHKPDTTIEVDISDQDFMALVTEAKQRIIEGEVFQIVISRCFKKQYTASPFEIYRALCRVSPAPYMFYFPLDKGVLVGASPEKLISVQKGQVEITPIAGTRPREEKSDNEAISAELLGDKKEVAEHMMLVDLGRNDIGAVCEPGSIEINTLLKVKHFSHVSHITSTLRGQLAEGKDALDALISAFPAGTLTGAPKIRAMEIIDELERSERGLYGGAICRLDYGGNLDSCIAIRMAVLNDGVALVRTGAGIVYDSHPEAEANETRHKARSILAALSLAEEGLE